MKYAIVKVINGAYSIHAEGFTNIASAKTYKYKKRYKQRQSAQQTKCIRILHF